MGKKRKPAEPASFWDLIEAQQEGDKPSLAQHGLDRPYRGPGIRHGRWSNHAVIWDEIERQTKYLIDHWRELRPSVAARRAGLILGLYMSEKEPPSPGIVFLVGQIMGASLTPLKYAKKPQAIMLAAEYIRRHPEASNAEVALHVGVAKPTVGRWRKDGHLPPKGVQT